MRIKDEMLDAMYERVQLDDFKDSSEEFKSKRVELQKKSSAALNELITVIPKDKLHLLYTYEENVIAEVSHELKEIFKIGTRIYE